MIVSAHDERAVLLGEVDRFARQAVEPRVARPEHPMAASVLAAILAEAEALGIAGSEAEPSGLAPWEDLPDGGPPGATLDLLARLGRTNVAVAYVVHQRALGRAVLRGAGLGSAAGAPAIAPEGRMGLGRTTFARLMAGAALGDEDLAVAADLYGPGSARVVSVDPGFGALVTPVWVPGAGGSDRTPTLEWQVHDREALALDRPGPAHGLDELWTGVAEPRRAAQRASRLGPDGRAFAAAVFAAHQLALCAIALGAVTRALEMARAFATNRHQGGGPIERHPAVLALLGQGAAVRRAVRAQLEGMAARPLGTAALGDALALRSRAHPALVDAANAALQVLGGMGYMRDTGLEKVLRDVNHLRVLAGSPMEVGLVVAEWERLHA